MQEIYVGDGLVTLVSDCDYDLARQHKWRVNEDNASGKPYVVATIKRVTTYLHRLITDCPKIYKVDHWDRNTLNNQRPNLRIATHDQNNLNRCGWGMSPYKGVTRDGRRFRCRITFDGDVRNLGRFDDPVEAARAYDAAAHDLFGEFAYLNFPEDYPPPFPDKIVHPIPF